MRSAAPVRLPAYQDDLTSTELGHLRSTFIEHSGDLAEAFEAAITRLGYWERKALYYDRIWVIALGPPTRSSSFTYQAWMAYTVRLPFHRVARYLERVELCLLAADTAGRYIRTHYEPRLEHALIPWWLEHQACILVASWSDLHYDKRELTWCAITTG
jgi:hypothetical protein